MGAIKLAVNGVFDNIIILKNNSLPVTNGEEFWISKNKRKVFLKGTPLIGRKKPLVIFTALLMIDIEQSIERYLLFQPDRIY